MEITLVVDPLTRAGWRHWLTEHHAAAREAWLPLRHARMGQLSYLDAVEEALCFGWIDGIVKKHGDAAAHRFTPRRPKGNWTELNKERCRRLIAAGQMTEAGRRILPDLTVRPPVLASDIEARLRAAGAWSHFERLPSLYVRVRLSNIEDVRRRSPATAEAQIQTFVERTARGELYGNWNDEKMRRS